jgi:cell division protein FtsW
MARTLRSDQWLFWATLALVTISFAMVVNTSLKGADAAFTKSAVKQLVIVSAGLVAMFVAMRLDYHRLREPRVIWTLLAVSVAGLIAVYFVNDVRKGATRWIPIGGFTFQPSELAKLAAIVFAAAVLERRMHRINDTAYSLLPIGIVTGVLSLLIVLEPDLGTAVALAAFVGTMAIAAGLGWRQVMVGVLASLPVLTYFVITEGYRVLRMVSFLGIGKPDPAVEHQIRQSLIALGSGGTFGNGLGSSTQKAFFLPEAHNDFIFAIVGEELGLVGTTLMLACFAFIAWRGLRAALLAPDKFGVLMGIGLTMMIGLQALINMSVVTKLAPTKGIPLPLVSAGGSSLVINLIAIGILLNISQQASPVAAASVDTR